MPYKIQPPYYPVVYVRGYAMTESEREETFHDTYYGFAATSVEKRQVPPPQYLRADMFEGQLIRFMKMGKFAYFDATNRGLEDSSDNPSRSLWVCRFYDEDVLKDKPRDIVDHAKELYHLVCEVIPTRLEDCGVDLGPNRRDYKVILAAHSMGGLVCRTLIQNILPGAEKQPKDWIHRLVTMGTPHKGIELGRIPDFLERAMMRGANPFNANIFEEKRMRNYLKLPQSCEPHSLGEQTGPFAFPVKRCFCLIGSDYESYGAARHLTGTFSDGLVKQDRAYVVAGKPDAKGKYGQSQKAYWANVHRAHSGRRGIVNSYESFENIHRFLFGNVKAEIYLENVSLNTNRVKDTEYYYDVEFALSIRGMPVYLHRRQQDPCENAIRYGRDEIEAKTVLLHTVFMNSDLKVAKAEPFSHFQLQFRVRERAIKKGFLWDREYPDKTIYSEDVEMRVGDFDETGGTDVQFRWLAEEGDWRNAEKSNAGFRIPLRKAGSLGGNLLIVGSKWPDEGCEDGVPPLGPDERQKRLKERYKNDKPRTTLKKPDPN
jgi:hypothetical protein